MSDEVGDDQNPRTNVRGAAPQWGPPPGQQPAGQPPQQPAQQPQWGPPPGQYPPPVHQQAPAQYAAPYAAQPAAPTGAETGGKGGPKRSPVLGIGLLIGALVLGLLGGLLGGKLAGGGDDGKVDANQLDITGVNLQDLVSVQTVAQRVLPAVVKIEAINSRTGSTGSGVVLTEDGEILTNYHVVHAGMQPGGRMRVFFNDGTARTASVIGVDPATDIALIKADDAEGLATLKFGSPEDIKVGQAVVAVGSPYGLDSTVTAGIISTLNRPVAVPGMDNPNEPMIYPAVQTDAAINPGNSGGALVNIKGELVGMNSANRLAASGGSGSGDLGSIGIGWAIPVDVIEPILEQLRKGEDATHAWLGIQPGDAQNSGIAQGALVEGFTSDSPAEEAGIERGDVITAIDEKPVAEGLALLTTALHYRPGDEVTVTLTRDGKEQEVTVTLGEQADLIRGLDG